MQNCGTYPWVVWLKTEFNLKISTGPGGRCCHSVVSDCNSFKGYVPELSLIFCATRQEFVHLGKTLKAVLRNRRR